MQSFTHDLGTSLKLTDQTATTNGSYSYTVTATGTSTLFNWSNVDTNSPRDFYLDNIMIQMQSDSLHCFADVVSYSDYYPFGMAMPFRNDHAADGEHRYGFQGQEMDDEIKGEGNSINFEFRMHDPRIGRFFAVDPLTAKYPYYTPYQFSGNRLIDAIELEGLEPIVINGSLVGYKVIKGQGFIKIAEDINDPETQKRYGYSLSRKVGYKEIRSYDEDEKVHPGDFIEFVNLEVEQILEQNIKRFEGEVKDYNKRITNLENKISSNDYERMLIEAKAQQTYKDVGEPDQGDPKTGLSGAAIAKNAGGWKKDYDLQNHNKSYKARIKEYRKEIERLKEAIYQNNQTLEQIQKNAQKLNNSEEE